MKQRFPCFWLNPYPNCDYQRWTLTGPKAVFNCICADISLVGVQKFQLCSILNRNLKHFKISNFKNLYFNEDNCGPCKRPGKTIISHYFLFFTKKMSLLGYFGALLFNFACIFHKNKFYKKVFITLNRNQDTKFNYIHIQHSCNRHIHPFQSDSNLPKPYSNLLSEVSIIRLILNFAHSHFNISLTFNLSNLAWPKPPVFLHHLYCLYSAQVKPIVSLQVAGAQFR